MSQNMSERRAYLVDRVAAMRANGAIYRDIADRLGISLSYAAELAIDPHGIKTAQRKAKQGGACVDCGAVTSYGAGGPAERCGPCAMRKNGGDRKIWTRDAIVLCIQEWAAEHGDYPSVNDWGMAIHTVKDEARHATYKLANAAGECPSFTTVITAFGTWNAAIKAAGFAPRPDHGGGGNMLRTRRSRARQEATA